MMVGEIKRQAGLSTIKPWKNETEGGWFFALVFESPGKKQRKPWGGGGKKKLSASRAGGWASAKEKLLGKEL